MSTEETSPKERRFTDEVASFSLEPENRLNSNAIEAYKRDGVVCIRNAFGRDWLALIETGIDSALSGASTNLDVVKGNGVEGDFSFSSQAWMEVEPFRQFIFDSHAADLAWPFLESKSLVLFYDFLLIKQPRSQSAATPWHQDHSYYPLSGTKVINCWTALDTIPLETALRFVRGSHRPPTLYRAVNFESSGNEYRHARGERPPPPDFDNDDNAEILSTAMQPGDMLVWNSYTFHSAPGNRRNSRRAAFSLNWVGDDVTYTDTPALDTYRDPSLSAGQPIVCAKFPCLRGEMPVEK